jgi:curved DNA-binding protein CbpA
MGKKLYNIIGVDEKADAATIRKAYRKLALKYHPDRNLGEGQEEAAKKFKEVAQAYGILSDEEKRQQYDQGLINDNGEEQFAQQPSQPDPMYDDIANKPKKKPNRAPHSSQSNFSTRPTFFDPKPALYYFFNEREEAERFKPQHKAPNVRTFIYVTPSPLDVLFSRMNQETSGLDQSNGYDKPDFVEATHENPPHVFMKTNYEPRIEHIIDRLLMSIVLDLLESVTQLLDDNSFQQTKR